MDPEYTIQPGDIVLIGYYDGQDNNIRTMPAVVTHVWSPDCVNLFIFPDATFLPAGATMTSISRGLGINEWH